MPRSNKIHIVNKNGDELDCNVNELLESINSSDISDNVRLKIVDNILINSDDCCDMDCIKPILNRLITSYADDRVLVQTLKLLKIILTENYDV